MHFLICLSHTSPLRIYVQAHCWVILLPTEGLDIGKQKNAGKAQDNYLPTPSTPQIFASVLGGWTIFFSSNQVFTSFYFLTSPLLSASDRPSFMVMGSATGFNLFKSIKVYQICKCPYVNKQLFPIFAKLSLVLVFYSDILHVLLGGYCGNI